MDKETAAARTAKNSFLTPADVDVTLTFPWAPEPIVFPCGLIAKQSAVDLRQKHYAQGTEAQEAGQHKYHCEYLQLILTGPPKGLPGFDGSETVAEYLGDPTSPRSVLIAAEAVESYIRQIKPAEFFR